VKLDCGYRLDLLVEERVIVEIKVVDHLGSIHQAQLLSYLKLSGCKVGLLINFNVKVLKDGIRRVVNDFPDSPRAGADSAVNKYDYSSRSLTAWVMPCFIKASPKFSR
jgi:hypothetical protein